jgi:hypothetical protein
MYLSGPQVNFDRPLLPEEKDLAPISPPAALLGEFCVKVPNESCEYEAHLCVRKTVRASLRLSLYPVKPEGNVVVGVLCLLTFFQYNLEVREKTALKRRPVSYHRKFDSYQLLLHG